MKRLVIFALGVLLCLALVSWKRSHLVQDPLSRVADFPSGLSNRIGASKSAIPKVADPATEKPARSRSERSHSEVARHLSDLDFLKNMRFAREGDSIEVQLPDGLVASGSVKYLERSGAEVIYVSGRLSQPQSGKFFFQRQTEPGIAGASVGVVEFPASRKAYRIETGPDGPHLVERSVSDVVCLDLPQVAPSTIARFQETSVFSASELPTTPIPDYQKGIVSLQSLSAPAVIYLDFQGGSTPTWDGVTYERPNFSNAEIFEIWRRVAEDYVAFNINVTTDLRVFEGIAAKSRQRVIITPTDTVSPGAGGAAYNGSFNWTGDTPCWVFVTSVPKFCAEACAHEAGHTLGLSHNGRNVSGTHFEYYDGHGEGELSWSPIMGRGYAKSFSQWSKGEYVDANNLQDQLALITSQNNGVQYRADDTGDRLGTSRYLEVFDDSTASAEGIIERTSDIDAFQFTTGGGTVFLRADPAKVGANLAIQASLCDAADRVLIDAGSPTSASVALSTNLPPGTYTFRVSGSGRNNPLTNGFSAYGSLGFYSITGSVANAQKPTRFVVSENLPRGAVIGVIPANNPNGDPLSYVISGGSAGSAVLVGSLTNGLAIDGSGRLSVVYESLLDYETLARNSRLPGGLELFVDILNLRESARTEKARRVIITVLDVNERPRISGFRLADSFEFRPPFQVNSNVSQFGGLQTCFTNCTFEASVREHAALGFLIGTFRTFESDLNTALSHSIVAGNSDNRFAIDPESGAVTVVGDLNAAKQNIYNLTIVVADQGSPPLTDTANLMIHVELPYARGSISAATYTNVGGFLLSALTNHPSFPIDPAGEKKLTQFEIETNSVANSGMVLRGYLLPPATGDYTFWIASQENSELWLSSSTNPLAAKRLAFVEGEGARTAQREWSKYPSQRSAPIHLATGYAYYIEARLKNGASSNGHLTVAWENASSGLTREVISGKHLAPCAMNYLPHGIGFETGLHRDALVGSLVGQVAVADLNAEDRHTFSIVEGNETGTFEIDPTSGAVRLAKSLFTSPATETSYTLLAAVTDNGTPALSGNAAARIRLVAPDAVNATLLHQEIWTNISSGIGLSNLAALPKYPKRPDLLRPSSSLDSGVSLGTNFISRLRGYLLPTHTGPYTFFIAGTGDNRLRLSFGDDPLAAGEIAFTIKPTEYRDWTQLVSQKSGFIWLEAGRRYFIEVLHRQMSGTNHVAVAWTGPGLPETNIVAAPFLATMDINYAPEFSAATLRLPFTATNGTRVTTLAATDAPADALVYQLVSGNVSNTFTLDATTGQLTVADDTLLAAQAIGAFNLLVQVQDSGYGGLYPLKATQATISIQVVDDSPAVVWTGGGNDPNWNSGENWNVGVPRDGSKLIFSGTARLTNHNNLLLRAGAITLSSGFAVAGNPLVLEGGIVSRGDNTWAINSTLKNKQTFRSTSRTLTIAGAVHNGGYDLTVSPNAAVRFDGVLSGSGGVIVSGGGNVTMASSNSYTGPTTINQGMLQLTDAGAIDSSSVINLQNPGTIIDTRRLNRMFTVARGQTLKGSGMVLGQTTILGTLDQSSSLGQYLTFSNRLVLAGRAILRLNEGVSVPFDPAAPGSTSIFIPGIPGTTISFGNYARFLTVATELQCGGHLVVSNANHVPQLGQAFVLFSAPRISGAFESLVLPPLGRGLEWDSSKLTVDGTLRVAAAPPKLELVTFADRSLVIRFEGARGVNYVVESAPTLKTSQPKWSVVATRSGTGGTMTAIIQLEPNETQLFVRIRIVP